MSILIGKHVKKMIAADATAHGLLADRVYPVIIPEGAEKFPFVCYCPEGITTDYSKDVIVRETSSVSVLVVSNKYDNMLETAEAVRKALESKAASYEQFSVDDARLVSKTSDEWIEEAGVYAVGLVFEFEEY